MAEPRSPRKAQGSNVYKIEDLIAYAKCPLRYRLGTWDSTETVVDAREAIRISTKEAIRAYLGSTLSGPKVALERATGAYKRKLIEYDNQGLFDGDVNWLVNFNFGLVLIREFHELLDLNRDCPIAGPKNCSVELDGDIVQGDLDGFLSFNVDKRSELRFGIVSVSQKPVMRATWDRMREGFAFSAFRKILGNLQTVTPVTMINVDPWARKITEYQIGRSDKEEYETLARVAINGIKAEVFMPQPVKANCRTCPFDKSCDIKYARPGEHTWHKREFLGSRESKIR